MIRLRFGIGCEREHTWKRSAKNSTSPASVSARSKLALTVARAREGAAAAGRWLPAKSQPPAGFDA